MKFSPARPDPIAPGPAEAGHDAPHAHPAPAPAAGRLAALTSNDVWGFAPAWPMLYLLTLSLLTDVTLTGAVAGGVLLAFTLVHAARQHHTWPDLRAPDMWAIVPAAAVVAAPVLHALWSGNPIGLPQAVIKTLLLAALLGILAFDMWRKRR